MLVLVPIRVFLAAGWLRAGIEKLVDARWWKGEGLRSFLEVHDASAVPFFRPIMEHAIHPLAILVAFVVMATEICCGFAIGVGRSIRAALRCAAILNVTFVLCGQVSPSAFYLIMEIVLLLAVADGTIATRPTMPSRRTYALVGSLLSAAVFLVRYIRTIEPAKVIRDPAIMLVFLAVLEAATLILRCVFVNAELKSSESRSIWSQRVTEWVRARPRTSSSPLADRAVAQRSALTLVERAHDRPGAARVTKGEPIPQLTRSSVGLAAACRRSVGRRTLTTAGAAVLCLISAWAVSVIANPSTTGADQLAEATRRDSNPGTVLTTSAYEIVAPTLSTIEVADGNSIPSTQPERSLAPTAALLPRLDFTCPQQGRGWTTTPVATEYQSDPIGYHLWYQMSSAPWRYWGQFKSGIAAPVGLAGLQPGESLDVRMDRSFHPNAEGAPTMLTFTAPDAPC